MYMLVYYLRSIKSIANFNSVALSSSYGEEEDSQLVLYRGMGVDSESFGQRKRQSACIT